MKENIKEIRNIESRYGLVLFRMGLSHLVDVGHRNLDDASVKEGVEQIMAQEKANAVEGKISVMTPEFQCEILRCAAELARFSIWTLFAYIKKYVDIGGL